MFTVLLACCVVYATCRIADARQLHTRLAALGVRAYPDECVTQFGIDYHVVARSLSSQLRESVGAEPVVGLDVVGRRLSSDEWEFLLSIPSVRYLDASSTNIGAQQMAVILDRGNIESLFLDGTDIPLDVLQRVASDERLKVVGLGCSSATMVLAQVRERHRPLSLVTDADISDVDRLAVESVYDIVIVR